MPGSRLPVAFAREAVSTLAKRIPAAAATVALGCLFLAAGVGEALAQETGRVAGTVRAASDLSPLAGAQVSVRGTGLGALTDEEGQFSIRGVPAGSHTLEVRLIGHGQVTRDIQVTAGQTATVEVEMRQQALEMESIVVTGTAGGARRREIGNRVTQISAEQIENVPVARVADVLQGRSPGATILENSGMVGAGTTIRLRGHNSLGNNQPLVYVDGVRVNIDNTRNAYEDEANQTISPLDGINPQDIERIEVVNGPSATTLYGTEASGGVIQIFTKSGSGAETAQWSASIEQGMNTLPHVGPKHDETELNLNCGLRDPVPPGCPESGSFIKEGHKQKYALSVRGGIQQIDYYTSGNWGQDNGVFGDQGRTEYGMRGNFGFQPSSALRIQFNNFYSNRDITWIPDGNNAEGLLLNVFRGDAGYTPDSNDALTLEMDLTTQVQHFTSGVNATWSPGAGVTQTLKAGIDFVNQHYQETKPWQYFLDRGGSRESDEYHSRTLTLDYTGTWRTELTGDFASSFSWGGQLFQDTERRLDGFGEDFAGPGPKLVEDGATTAIFDEDLQTIVEGGAFLQEQVAWKDRLFLTGGVRFDGNSTFGEDFGVEIYPKVQGSYMLSDGEFWPDWWGTMKLRGAYGWSGRSPGPFDKLRTWSSVGLAGRPGVSPGNVGNPDLGPERTREWEAGFEAGMFDERLSLEATRYDQRTTDALVSVQPIPSMGFTSRQLKNVGELKNAGWEIATNLSVVRDRDVSWDVGFQFSTNESEVIDLGDQDRLYAGWRQWIAVGEPIPVMIQERVRNPDAPWDQMEINPDSVIGPTMPTHSWSANTDLVLARRVTLKATGEFQGGHFLSSGTAYQNVRRFAWTGKPEGSELTCIEIQQRMQAGNTQGLTAGERAHCDRNATSYGMWTKPADFFKLRTAAVSYRIPEQVLPVSLQGATFTVSGRNLLKITDYPGVDPEAFEDGSASSATFRQEYYNVPPLRSFSATLSLNF